MLAAIWILAAIGAGVLIWQTNPLIARLPFFKGSFLGGALLFLITATLYAALAFFIKQALGGLLGKGSIAWAYRLCLLLPLAMALLRWAVFPPSQDHLALCLAGGLCGAWMGAMLTTMVAEGFYENNFPPDPFIAAEVLRIHRQRIGTPPPPPLGKRAFDIALSLLGLALSAPLAMIAMTLIWLEDPGYLLFVKNSVGRGGTNFRQWKLRTMVKHAEQETGPIVSSRQDERVLLIGRFLRKTALDELPQLVNILLGEMSFVGPRPQRTVVVYEYLQSMPEYADRHQVAPGLSGFAQVAGKPYRTPRQKLRYDRLYVRHAGLLFDLKLIGLAFLIVFWLRWRGDWHGMIPRRWLRAGTRSKHSSP
jgi:lipopolysaccharide/colanic/teichoic acid biosynthesis glycosyltransferase